MESLSSQLVCGTAALEELWKLKQIYSALLTSLCFPLRAREKEKCFPLRPQGKERAGQQAPGKQEHAHRSALEINKEGQSDFSKMAAC